MIGRAGVGVDNVDVDAATRRGIVVANAPESNVVSAAEHTIGLLMALARNIPQAHAALVDGRWERSKWGGVELADKVLGVLGFGRIGRQVARRALGLQMKVIAYDPFVAADRFRELGVESATFDDVLARADFLTLHLPLTDETRGAIDAAAIAKMRDGVRIVNAARGDLLVDDAARRRARVGQGRGRRDRRLRRGAVLAARCSQRRTSSLTPHLAASTEEAQDRAGVIVAEQVAAALEGGLVTNAVNIPTVGADDLEVLGPYIPLAAKLGRFAMELAGGDVRKLTIEVYGELAEYDTRLLTVAALNGAFQGRTDQPVNYVNAPVVAADRGIDVVEEKRRSSRDFTNLVAVSADGVAGRRHDDRQRRPALARLGARLRARDGARAAARAPPLRRRARRDRPRRHALRRGGRQHREHGRLPHPRGREGADGALDRRPPPAATSSTGCARASTTPT